MLPRVLRQARWAWWDSLLVALAVAHGGLLLAQPSIALIALGLWWNANTISHNFIHRPFFRSRSLSLAFSCYLSLLLSLPQSLWRARHLAHHGIRDRSSWHSATLDCVAVFALWAGLLVFAPHFVLTVYLPGFLTGLGLCYLQGHYEHVGGVVSHYGWLYNLLLFNDGYHTEHHAHPGRHWRELPSERLPEATSSRWPALLRWLECVNLCALERLVLHSPALQQFVLRRHELALRQLLDRLPVAPRVGIVGGGLFPRTAIILSHLLPASALSLIDLSAENLSIARCFIAGEAQYIHERFDAAAPNGFDLLIIPLSFVGDREAIYQRPPAQAVLVHDWLWRRRGTSVVVSWVLLKRLNLVVR
jgi:hypothetical protein